MSRIIKSRRALVLGIVAALGIAAAAFAYWTTSGSGTGTAGTGDAAAVNVTQVGTIAGLVPGGAAQAVDFKIANGKTTSQYVTSVSVSIDSIKKTADNTTATGCTTADFTIVQPTAINRDLAAGDTTFSPSGASIAMNDATTNQDACKNVTVNLAYAAV
jgi:hypothetical protein